MEDRQFYHVDFRFTQRIDCVLDDTSTTVMLISEQSEFFHNTTSRGGEEI